VTAVQSRNLTVDMNDNIVIIFGMRALQEYRHPILDFLTTGFLRVGAVNPTLNPQPLGPGLRICDPRRQSDPRILQGTGYQF
jgi:hypothetical protein